MAMAVQDPGVLGGVAGVPFGLSGGSDLLFDEPPIDDFLLDDSGFSGSVLDTPTFADDREFFVPTPGPEPTTFDQSLEAGERHIWIFTVDDGQSVGVTLHGADRLDGGIGDPFLEIQTPDGGWFTQNDDNEGLSSGLQFTADSPGDWRVVASDLNRFAGAYELTLEVVEPGETPSIGASTATGFDSTFGPELEDVATLDVASGSTLEWPGALEFGGFDLYELPLVAGDRIIVTAQDADGSGLDSRLALLGPAENTLAENDDAASEAGLGVFDSRIEYTASETGVHLIEMHSFGDMGEGTYVLTVTRN